MKDLVVFSVGTNQYAINIENVQRIIQAVELTTVPNSHQFLDGIMSHEDKVIKILSLRKTIGLPTYKDELDTLFTKLKADHKGWVEALKRSIYSGAEFTKTFNPHMCDLGKWIDGFTAYDDRVSEVLSELVRYHKILHSTGAEAYEFMQSDMEKAKRIVDVDMQDIFGHTMGALDTFVNELSLVSNSLQKILIYENSGKTFGIKVDTIEDIAHIEDEDIMQSDHEEEASECLELEGVLDLNGTLINIIKSVSLPK